MKPPIFSIEATTFSSHFLVSKVIFGKKTVPISTDVLPKNASPQHHR
jgi:hypothetical protein